MEDIDRNGRKKVAILNVRIDSSPMTSVLRYIRNELSNFDSVKSKNPGFLVVTPNPEQVMQAQNDPVFAKILNSADISIPDGVGLVAAHKFFQLPTTDSQLLKPLQYFAQGLGVGFSVLFDKVWLTTEVKVIRGRELFMELIKLANKKRWRVFLLGNRLHSAQKAVNELKKNYKGIKLSASSGPNLDEDANPVKTEDKEVEKKAIDNINKVKPHLLFVGFGAPKQEKWLYRHKDNLKMGGAMMVGGTFDYISGKKKVPPKWIADMGLEWLWRLIIGDQKGTRVLSAFPEFPLKIFFEKLRK